MCVSYLGQPGEAEPTLLSHLPDGRHLIESENLNAVRKDNRVDRCGQTREQCSLRHDGLPFRDVFDFASELLKSIPIDLRA